jgi:hypothetical protein
VTQSRANRQIIHLVDSGTQTSNISVRGPTLLTASLHAAHRALVNSSEINSFPICQKYILLGPLLIVERNSLHLKFYTFCHWVERTFCSFIANFLQFPVITYAMLT